MPESSPVVQVRQATTHDVEPMLALVNELAVQQIMLPRSPASVVENLRDFHIAEVDGEFAGCGALAITWTDLAEIRSLAVHPKHQKLGIGRALADALIDDARRLGIAQLFAFTYVPGFFEKLSFRYAEHEQLPHKVFNDCMHCPKFMACDEIAMTRVLDSGAAGRPNRGGADLAFPLPRRTTEFVRPTKAAPRSTP